MRPVFSLLSLKSGVRYPRLFILNFREKYPHAIKVYISIWNKVTGNWDWIITQAHELLHFLIFLYKKKMKKRKEKKTLWSGSALLVWTGEMNCCGLTHSARWKWSLSSLSWWRCCQISPSSLAVHRIQMVLQETHYTGCNTNNLKLVVPKY